MRDADGAACPMHRHAASKEAPVLRSVCDPPLAGLAALLLQHGIPVPPIVVSPDNRSSAATVLIGEHPEVQPVSPDTPPPRA
jgi:hypothetical protein